MAHMGRAEGYEQDFSADNDEDDDLDIVTATRKDLADTTDYIQGTMGALLEHAPAGRSSILSKYLTTAQV